MRSVLGSVLEEGVEGDVVVDMEAGLEHLSRGTTRHVQSLFAIAEPYYRSMETARRVCELGRELGIERVALVANKVRTAEDEAALRDFASRHDLPLAATVPYDEEVVRADRTGAAFIEAAPAAPALRALEALTDALASGRL